MEKQGKPVTNREKQGRGGDRQGKTGKRQGQTGKTKE
jgi:hypothetical protein